MKGMRPGTSKGVELGFMLLALAACAESPGPVEPDAGVGLRLSSVLGEIDDKAFARAQPDYRLTFPRDHGVHPAFRSEWWYLTLLLEDAEGHSYGGQFTLFRQALEPINAEASVAPWQDPQLYMAHLAVSDVTRREHREAERFSRAHPQLAGVRGEPFAAWIDNWRLESITASGLFPLRLTAAGDAFGWKLELQTERPLALQGASGFSAKGPGQASHYYSYTRLSAAGELRLDDRRVTVSGSAWLDREWSTSVLGSEQAGWDWFALQLDDGRDVMAFRLRRRDCDRDPFDHGLLVSGDGRQVTLDSTRFELEPLRWWQPDDERPRPPLCAGEQRGYPVRWRFRLDDELFEIEAAFDDQRMQTSVRYWEGLVWVRAAGARVGKGYLEMTGYGGPGTEEQSR